MTIKEKKEIQKSIIDKLPLKPHGRLILSPRIGKTKMIIDIIKLNKPKSILWVTPSSELATVDIPNEFIKWKAKRYLSKLTTVTWTSLNKKIGHYEMIVFDEEQYITLNNISSILSNILTCDYLLSMTGTATKHEDKKDLYKLLNLKVLVDVNINKAVDMGILADYSINVIEIDMSVEKNIQAGNKDKRFMTSELENYKYLHNSAQTAIFRKGKDAMFKILARMRAIYNSKTKTEVAKYLINNLTGKKLVFCASINQAEELSEYTYHSKTDDKSLIKFNNNEIETITMVNSGGIGYTYKQIENLIIVQCNSDKNGDIGQKIARSLLEQKNYKANIWILCLIGTKDEQWVESALQNFDKEKVTYKRFKNFKL